VGKIFFITGTDTGVGKTVLTASLLYHLRRKKIHALAMKPFCTGNREDVEILQKLQPGELSNAEVNPYFFPEPIAPAVAAQMHGEKIHLKQVLAKIFQIGNRCDVLLIEGFGGLMVPLGVNFLVRDLIAKSTCPVIVASRNQLGTINHTLLSVFALQEAVKEQIKIVMIEPEEADFSTKTNRKFLTEMIKSKIFSIPFLGQKAASEEALEKNYKKVQKTLAAIIRYD
jgi:dethiobiotin synthetase